jgi:hypothetical protein
MAISMQSLVRRCNDRRAEHSNDERSSALALAAIFRLIAACISSNVIGLPFRRIVSTTHDGACHGRTTSVHLRLPDLSLSPAVASKPIIRRDASSADSNKRTKSTVVNLPPPVAANARLIRR